MFEVRGTTALARLPEAWWAGVTVAEGDREATIHVLIPDRGQEEPSADWIEAELRSKLDEQAGPAIDQLEDLARPYYGVRHRVVRLD